MTRYVTVCLATALVLLGVMQALLLMQHEQLVVEVAVLRDSLRAQDSIVASHTRDLRVERDSLVVREARALGLSPSLALGVAWVENKRADSAAVSRAGAVGLMQIMPPEALAARGDSIAGASRAAYIAAVCGVDYNLVERECNVKVGLRIYRDALLAYGSENRALAAYNGALGYPAAARVYVAAVHSYARAFDAIGSPQ